MHRPFYKELWRGEEGEADKRKYGRTTWRSGQGNHLQRPRLWHTTVTDGTDWCTAHQYGAPTTPPGVKGASKLLYNNEKYFFNFYEDLFIHNSCRYL